MAQIVTITNPLTGQPAQVDQLEHTAQQIDDSIGRALPGGEIDTLLAGKAPAGYGLGSAFNSASDANTIVAFGCYSTKVNTPTGDWCTILHIPYGENNATQYAKIGEGYDYQRKCAAKRDKIKGTWQPWEWVNPPMILGIEYRTAERYLGKPVYTKLVDCGVGPNATRKRVSAGISNVDRAVSANGSWGNMSIPYEWFSGDASGAQAITITLNDTYIDIASTVNYSGRTIYALIKYTKTTD